MSRYRVRITLANAPYAELVTEHATLRVGRMLSNDIVLRDLPVSRLQCILALSDDGLTVDDRSEFGTRAGDTLVHGRTETVPWGTPLRVGDYEINVERVG